MISLFPIDPLGAIFPFLSLKESRYFLSVNKHVSVAGKMRHAWNREWKRDSVSANTLDVMCRRIQLLFIQTPRLQFLALNTNVLTPSNVIDELYESLNLFSNLTSIDLYGPIGSVFVLGALAKDHASKILSLTFGYAHPRNFEKKKFIDSIICFHNLQTLICTWRYFYSDAEFGLEYLSKSSLINSLTHLNLKDHGDAHISDELLHLGKFQQLKTLLLNGYGVDFNRFAQCINQLHQLEELELCDHSFKTLQCFNLLQKPASIKRLKMLDGWNTQDFTAFDVFANLEELSLQTNWTHPLKKATIDKKVLNSCSSRLTSLNMQTFFPTDLIEQGGLDTLSGLKELRCHVTALRRDALNRVAKFSPLLKTLCINGCCSIDEHHLRFDVRNLKQFQHLQKLQLVDLNWLTDKEIQQLIDNCPPRLCNLCIYSCAKIASSSLFLLAAAPATVRLSLLDFHYVGFYSDPHELFFEAAKLLLHRNSLYFLKIADRYVFPDLLEQLQQYFSETVRRPSHLPGCEIFIS